MQNTVFHVHMYFRLIKYIKKVGSHRKTEMGQGRLIKSLKLLSLVMWIAADGLDFWNTDKRHSWPSICLGRTSVCLGNNHFPHRHFPTMALIVLSHNGINVLTVMTINLKIINTLRTFFYLSSFQLSATLCMNIIRFD